MVKLRVGICILSVIKDQLLHNQDDISQDHLHVDGSVSSFKTGNDTFLPD